MRFERPSTPSEFTERDGTVILPAEEGEYPAECFTRFVSTAHGGGATTYERPLLEQKDSHFELDLAALAQLVWEHRQYSEAQEFSPSHMDVLRTVQKLSEDDDEIVLAQDVQRTLGTKYAESTISGAFGKLTDRGLLTKETDGVYRYTGFEGCEPPEEDADEGTD